MAELPRALPPNDPEFYLHRLIQRLLHRQDRYVLRRDYAIGNHPVPEGDPRYQKALRELQDKAITNYVGLAIKAVTERMKIRGFKFGGEVDQDAMKMWRANAMDMHSQIAIGMAAEFSDVYALVSPPLEEGGEPRITIEDPRVCIVEPDPVDPMTSVAGLKFYQDAITEKVIAVLMFPDVILTYEGPGLSDFLAREMDLHAQNIIGGVGGFTLIESQENPLGEVPLIRGAWQPKFGLRGMAECEDGGWQIQDRINWVILSRLMITKSQAFRQRWATGVDPPKDGHGSRRSPWEPAADLIWITASPDAHFGDFDQADLTQALEAARDDIGDFAALTQTPVTYLTNKMVNVSGETLTVAQASLVSKARSRMDSMGWFFERVMKLGFRYKGDERADDMEAETLWQEPEQRSLAEVADMVAKFTAAGVPLKLVLERAGFSDQEIEYAVEEAEKQRAQEMQDQMALTEQAAKVKQANSPRAGAS